MLEQNKVAARASAGTDRLPLRATVRTVGELPGIPVPPGPLGILRDGSVYDLVRRTLATLGLDRDNFGKPGWNPLGEIVSPGDTVLVKPNWVSHSRPGGPPPEVLITSAAVIRPVLDYISIALGHEGRIVLADAPMQSADFKKILEQTGVAELQKFWAGRGRPQLEVLDLRQEAVVVSSADKITERIQLPGDPAGYRAVQLGNESHFREIEGDWQKFRVTNYTPGEMENHHRPGCHEYLVAGSIIEADTVICLAKLKTHRKGGLTAALKNMVGINGCKDWLPHHRTGSIAEGGDEYPASNPLKKLAATLSDKMAAIEPGTGYRFRWQARRLAGMASRFLPGGKVFEGAWHGNDTLWRMVIDLNTLLFYAGKHALLENKLQRKYLALVDAVVAGQGDGPLRPEPKSAGTFLAGLNPLAVDAVSAALAGLNPAAVPMIAGGFEKSGQGCRYPLVHFGMQEVRIISNLPDWDGVTLAEPAIIPGKLNLRPAAGWTGKLELSGTDDEKS